MLTIERQRPKEPESPAPEDDYIPLARPQEEPVPLPPHKPKVIGQKKRRKKAKQVTGPSRTVLALGAMATLLVVIGALFLFRRGGGTEAATELLDFPTPDITQFEAVPWKVPAGQGAHKEITSRSITVDSQGMGILLPGGNYIAAETLNAVLGHVDSATGKPTVMRTSLGVNLVRMPFGMSHRIADVTGSADGRIAAFSAKQIHVWDSQGTKQRTIDVTASLSEDIGFGWAAGGQLLIVDAGKLAAYDIETGNKVFEVSENFSLPMALSPARNWLAITVDRKYLEIRDSATGSCLGRFGGEGRWRSLVITSDAKRLVGVRYAGPGDSPSTPYDHWFELCDWDLADGTQLGRVRFHRTDGDSLFAAGSSYVISRSHVSDGGWWFDLDHHVFVARPTLPDRCDYQREMVDGQLWCCQASEIEQAVNGRTLATCTFFVPATPIPEGAVALHPGMTVDLETQCDDGDSQAKNVMTALLKEAGYSVGPSPWKVRLKAGVYDTGKQMSAPRGVSVPGVRGEITFVAPDSTVFDTRPHQAKFPETESKYYRTQKLEGGNVSHKYDFEGRNARDAMTEEAWEMCFRRLPAVALPRGAWQANGKYLPLPLITKIASP